MDARGQRVLVAGGMYHVMSRGNRKQPVFLSDGDCELFLEIARRVVARREWTVHSYCLMPNHYHLLVQTPNADLSAGMQELNGDYGHWFNRVHGFVGHVFQGRFKSVLVESDGHLMHLTRYMAWNPVRAGFCRSPDGWRWSSFADTLDPARARFPVSSKVLTFFGDDEERARGLFRRFVDDRGR